MGKLTFALTADFHIGSLRSLKTVPYEEILKRSELAIDLVLRKIDEMDVRYAILAGDLLHNKRTTRHEETDLLFRLILSHPRTIFLILSGNHDKTRPDYSLLTFLSILEEKSHLRNVRVALLQPRLIDQPEGRFLLIPHTGASRREYRRIIKAELAKIPEDGKPLVVAGHEKLAGSCSDSGWKAPRGAIQLPTFLPWASKVNFWAFGDIHKMQKLRTRDKSTAMFCGPPLQVNSDEDPQKGFLVVKINGRRVETTKVPVPPDEAKIPILVPIEAHTKEELERKTESLPPNSWVILKAGVQLKHDISEGKVDTGRVVKTTTLLAGQAMPEKPSTVPGKRDLLSGLLPYLIEKEGLSEEDARRGVKVARDL